MLNQSFDLEEVFHAGEEFTKARVEGYLQYCDELEAKRAKERASKAANDNRPSGGNVVKATAYIWRDPALIPRREFLYGQHLIRKFLSATFGAGGGGKSLLEVTDSLAMITGRDLLGDVLPVALRVWYINLEDPIEETERRFAAAALHYGVSPEVLNERLFIDSGREQQFAIVREENRQTKVVEPVVRAIIGELEKNDIDVIIIDPFVSSHQVDENDNSKIQQVVTQWARVAKEADVAVELVHHVNKTASANHDIIAESGRGAGSLKDKCRAVRTINGMTKVEAEKFGIDPDERFQYFRVDLGKANLGPRSGRSDWRQMVSVSLDNGGPFGVPDKVGVVTPRKLSLVKNVADDVSAEQLETIKDRIQRGEYRENAQAKAWAGKVIAEELGWDAKNSSDKIKLKALIKQWVRAGQLAIEERLDDGRQLRPFVVVPATAATPATPPDEEVVAQP